ncbi:MAG: hypothetical protein V2A79_04010, partial [Planctomycetota bacterium]
AAGETRPTVDYPTSKKVGHPRQVSHHSVTGGQRDTDLFIISVLVGDADNNGVVGASDRTTLFAFWGSTTNCRTDVDENGITGASDRSVLFANWGNCAP